MGVYIWNRLPSEYQEVEYIESSGSQYINTGYVVNINTSRIYSKFEPQNVSTSQTSSNYQNPLFGTRTSDYNYETALWASPSSQAYSVGLTLNGHTMDSATPSTGLPKYPLGTVIELDYGKAGGTYNDFSWTWNAQYQGTTPNLLIFGVRSQGSVDARKFFGKLYSFKIYEGSNEVCNFIPCYRKSDSVIGLYDLVNNQFYTNSGSGTFTKGSDVDTYRESLLKNAYIGEVLIETYTISDIPDTNTNKYISIAKSGYVVNSAVFEFTSVGTTNSNNDCYFRISSTNSSVNRYGGGIMYKGGGDIYNKFSVIGRLNNNTDTAFREGYSLISGSGTNTVRLAFDRNSGSYTINGTTITWTHGTSEKNMVETIMNSSTINAYASRQGGATIDNITITVTYEKI